MKKISAAALAFLLGAFFLVSCTETAGPASSDSEENKLQVVTSFYTMFDFARKIGGDEVAVTNLVPAGVEAHDWEPSPQDIARLEKADVFVYNGAGMESWTADVLGMLQNDDLIVVETAAAIPGTNQTGFPNDQLLQSNHSHPNLEFLSSEHTGSPNDQLLQSDHSHPNVMFLSSEHLDVDPHVWLNPAYAKLQLAAIRDGFSEAAPELEDSFAKNYETAEAELEKLDGEYKDALDGLPNRTILVEHEAFYYLAEAYRLEQIGINSAHGAEPDAQQLAKIIDLAKSEGVTDVFYEGKEPTEISLMLARELGGESLRLNPYEGLSQQEIDAGLDYFAVMRQNLESLKKALES